MVCRLPARSKKFLSLGKRLVCNRTAPEAGSNCSSATDQLNNEDYQRNDQQDMDVRANHVESNEADQPKYQQNQKNCPKHRVSPEGKVLLRCTLVRLRPSGLPYHQN
jgi:hypothetical protein